MGVAFDDLYRIIHPSKSLSVGSSGGAVVSTGKLGTETYGVYLSSPGLITSTSGIRFWIGNEADSNLCTSTTGAFLPLNWLDKFKCTPGQTLYAISNDGVATQTLIVMEITK